MGTCTSRSDHYLVLEQMAALVKQRGAELDELKQQIATIKEHNLIMIEEQCTMLNELATTVRKIDKAIIQSLVNPWDCTDCTTKSDPARAAHLREHFRCIHRLSYPPFNMNKCWLTGKANTVVTHIIPDGVQGPVLQRLALDEDFVNNLSMGPYNLLLLTKPVKEAFDRLICSFIPVDVLQPLTFKLCVWERDAAARIVIGQSTLLDYHDCALDIPSNWVISRRALSYHALCAYFRHEGDGEAVVSGKAVTREWLVSCFETSMQEELREEEDCEGDGE